MRVVARTQPSVRDPGLSAAVGRPQAEPFVLDGVVVLLRMVLRDIEPQPACGQVADRRQDRVARHHDVRPAQIALAWLLAHPRVVIIPGASSLEQLESNVEAADVELSSQEVDELTAAATAISPRSSLRTLLDSAGGRVRRLFGG